jgi:ATP-dependent Clp protease ATP-binding subunit ClpB
MTSNVGADIIQTYMDRLAAEQILPDGLRLSDTIRSANQRSSQILQEESEQTNRQQLLEECRNEVLEVLKHTVRPEFLNRIDEVIMFEPLSQTDIREILRMQMADLQEKLSENGVTISFTQAFEDYMSTKGYEPAYGARPIKRLMQKELVNLLAKNILEGRVQRDSQIVVDMQDDRIVIRNQ